MDKKLYSLEGDPEGLVWKVQPMRGAKAYCKEHLVPLQWHSRLDAQLFCPVGHETYYLTFDIQAYEKYATEVIGNGKLDDYKVVRLDSKGSVVLAKESNKKDPNYFIESKLSDTQKGLELMVQAGKRNGDGKKVQLFVDLPAERLGFDKSDKDKHPAGLFAEVTAVFKNSETSIKSRPEK